MLVFKNLHEVIVMLSMDFLVLCGDCALYDVFS